MASLHSHSVYSVIDGRGTIADYIHLAKEDGQKAFALTDHGTLGGIIDLYNTAKKNDVKPIAGMELYVDAGELGCAENKKMWGYGHLTVLAKNEAGYRSLIACNNLAHRQFYNRPRVTLQQLVSNNFMENWVVLSGCMSSPIYQQTEQEAITTVQMLARHAANFFLEFMWHHSSDPQFDFKQWQYLERVAQLHRATGLPMVITNDCHFAHKHNERIHIELMHNSADPTELEFDGEGFHFKTAVEMQQICQDLGVPNGWDNAVEIGKMCNLVIPEADHINWYVPDITGGRPYEILDNICQTELYTLAQHVPNPDEYIDRYEHELSVLKTSPAILNSYLVTNDIVVWCREKGIPIAARGSMAGSLVSYLMGITEEDPVKYRLSFSRAVNPARPTIPDFDLDVSSARRSEVLDYLKSRYENNIPIASYTHFGPKGALSKILRMEGKHDFVASVELTKSLPDDWPVEYALQYDKDEGHYNYPLNLRGDGTVKVEVGGSQGQLHASNRVHEKWLENVPRNYWDPIAIYQGIYSSMSAHPCGILVGGPERVLEHEVPFQWVASSKQLVSQYDMYTLKKLGLFKLDVLGLRTKDQLKMMEDLSGTKVPDDNYDERDVLKAFGSDLLAEVFQMDGYACREVIRSIGGIENFEDIVAANTLARPGCSQFTRFYRSGFEGLIREYPTLEEILGVTNGLILYQEQVMEIARIIADFDDSEQDDVKEAIKYFRHEVWEREIEPKFRERCEAKGYNATNILKAISQMASYTFNRAHAMTYSAIAYKMMWYKIHHPTVYYAAVYDGAKDKQRLVMESHFFGVKWHPADINLSESETTVREGIIYLGLSCIKGVGPAAVEAISKVRPVNSLEDLQARVEKRRCNKNVVAKLIAAFALTSVGEVGNVNAFKECYEFPYNFLDNELVKDVSSWDGPGQLGGFIVNLHPVTVRKEGPLKGQEMCQLQIANINGVKRAVVFPQVWKKARGVLYSGSAVKLEGEYQMQSGDFIVEHGYQV